MFEIVKRILNSYTSVPDSEITLQSSITMDLLMDSLSIVNAITEIEDELNIEIDIDDLKDMVYVGDLVHYLEKYS